MPLCRLRLFFTERGKENDGFVHYFRIAPKPQREEFPPEQVNGQRACDRLSQAIQIKTISCEDESQTDWGAFDRFHAFLEQSYPLIHKNLKLDHISTASLLFYWEGTDPDLDPIAFLAHQDVVPISEGTEGDWEHPAFDGVNDGQFIWGRGALDMKNHLICLMESVETLLEEGYTPKRGVYLCLGHNEEIVSGGNNGARELARELERRGVHLDSVVDEGGAMLPAHVKGLLDANLTGVGVAEKGYADFRRWSDWRTINLRAPFCPLFIICLRTSAATPPTRGGWYCATCGYCARC